METLIHEIKSHFEELKTKNPKFSLRSLSLKLGLTAGEMSEILNHKRPLTVNKAYTIIDRLYDSPTERMLQKNKLNTQMSAPKKKITSKECQNIETVHFILLSLINSTKFQNDLDWLSEKTGSTKLEVRKSLQLLKSLGLITIDLNGKIERKMGHFYTSDDVSDEGIQRTHLRDLDLAKEKVLTVPVELRDYCTMTFLASPANIKKAKEILRRAQDEVEFVMQDEGSDQVYRIATYLYPLTPVDKNH